MEEREATVFAGDFVSPVYPAVAGITECRLVGATEDRGGLGAASITLHLHLCFYPFLFLYLIDITFFGFGQRLERRWMGTRGREEERTEKGGVHFIVVWREVFQP